MASRIPHQSTVERLLEARNGSGTLDGVVAKYNINVSKGTLSRVLNGYSVSEYAENEIRHKLGQERIYTRPAAICLSCLAKGRGFIVHTAGDCHDKPVADVVVLAEGERVVRRAKRPRTYPKCHRPRMTDEEYAEYLQWRAQRKDKA